MEQDPVSYQSDHWLKVTPQRFAMAGLALAARTFPLARLSASPGRMPCPKLVSTRGTDSSRWLWGVRQAGQRRFRGVADPKRQGTGRELGGGPLHHNTPRGAGDGKPTGKSPWEWVKSHVLRLEGPFVGVMMAASEGMNLPSPWALKG